MGLFHVPARLTGPTGRTEALELLVDTGATFLVVPRVLANRLALRPTRTCPLQMAGGREEIWPLAEARLSLDGVEVTTPCVIAPEGPALLGAVALESLLLAVDRIAKRLVPVKGFVGCAIRSHLDKHGTRLLERAIRRRLALSARGFLKGSTLPGLETRSPAASAGLHGTWMPVVSFCFSTRKASAHSPQEWARRS